MHHIREKNYNIAVQQMAGFICIADEFSTEHKVMSNSVVLVCHVNYGTCETCLHSNIVILVPIINY